MGVPTLAAAKSWLGVDFDDDDTLIQGLIDAGVETVSDYVGTAIGASTDGRRIPVQYRGNAFRIRALSQNEFSNPSALKLHAWNTDGLPFTITVGAGQYGVTVSRWLVDLGVTDAAWDALDAAGTVDTARPVELTLSCSVAADDIPADWRQAVLVLVAEQYHNRGDQAQDMKTVSQVLLKRIMPRL